MGRSAKRLAFVFPGQGSQKIGMGRDWYEETDVGRTIFDRADAVLGFPLRRICFEGPEEELRRTDRTQPGLFVCSVIVHDFLTAAGVDPLVVAGHSLGEYSALYAAGVFDLATGLLLVRTRGEAMGAAADARPGAMAAILGLEAGTVRDICDAAAHGGIVQVANFNAPTQTVISGERDAVERAGEAARAAGARRVLLLPVHGAFHSPLMEPAVARMQDALAGARLHDPRLPFLANTTGDFVREAEGVREGLARQILNSVRWTEIMEKIAAMDVEAVLEVGTGRVLSGLWRQGGSQVPARSCGTVEEARALVAELIA